MLSMTSFIIFPASLMLAGLANPLIDIMITSRWLPCAPLLTILCVGILPEHLYFINNDFLIVHGKSDYLMKEQTYSKIISTLLIIISIPFGLVVAAIVKGVCTLITWMFSLYYLNKVMDIDFRGQLRDLSGIFIISFILGVGNYLLFTQISYSIVNVAASLICSCLIYYIFSLRFYPHIIADFKTLKK